MFKRAQDCNPAEYTSTTIRLYIYHYLSIYLGRHYSNRILMMAFSRLATSRTVVFGLPPWWVDAFSNA